MPYGKKSPAKMGHSPMKKESAEQERKNLMKDMPVDKRASAMEMGHSPAEMGHSPLEGHCMGSPAKMGHESPMNMRGSWMSKHAASSRFSSSPLKQEKPDPNTLKNKKGQSQEQVMNQRVGSMNAAEAGAKAYQDKFKDIAFNTQAQVDRYNKQDSTNVANYNKARQAAQKSYDSISGVNDAYNKKVTAYNKKIDDMLNSPLNQGLILESDKRPKEVIQAEMKEQIRKGEEDGRLASRDGATGIQRIAKDLKGITKEAMDFSKMGAIPLEEATKAQKEKMKSTKYYH